MKITQLPDGRWSFDSGEVAGGRVRRIFDLKEDAEAFMRRAREIAKDEGERLLIECLGVSPAEIREIIEFRWPIIGLNGGKPDWQKGRSLHAAHLMAKQQGGLLGPLVEEYITRKRKAGWNEDYIRRLERELP